MRSTQGMSGPLSAALVALALGGLGGVAAGSLQANARSEAARETPSEVFAAHHAKVHKHLGHIDAKVAGLADAPDPRAAMDAIVDLLDTHVRTHAETEEANLYPLVDRYASPDADRPFTASMRFEHRVVGRWIDDLEGMAASSDADPDAFARRAQRLLGLLEAHFLAEEKVLMPVLDERMTGEAFRRQVIEPMGG